MRTRIACAPACHLTTICRHRHNAVTTIPLKLSMDELHGMLVQNENPKRRTHQLLSGGLLGVSPLLAKEAVYRSGAAVNQRAQDAQAESLWPALRTILEPLAARDWQPGLAGDVEQPTAFSVYPLARACRTGARRFLSTRSLSRGMVQSRARTPIRRRSCRLRKHCGMRVPAWKRARLRCNARSATRRNVNYCARVASCCWLINTP